jgi:hypothetical protein
MSTLRALARVLAAERESAQPICTVRHVHISDRPLVIIPLALSGEACAPLAAMVGDDPREPRLLIVPEPRDRDQRFAFAADLADVIGPYIDSYARDEPDDAPQFLLPNPAAVAFIRLLGRSTRFRRAEGAYAVPAAVPLLGRWLTFYTERAEVPPSNLTLALTDVLADHWATGQSPAEDRNLGAILGWIDPPPGMTGAQAALAAEDPVRCPPAGPATDPTFDNEVLEARMLAVRTARSTGDGRALARATARMAEALRTQFEPTWTLMWRAVDLLRALVEGGHVPGRWAADCAAFGSHVNHLRDGGPPQAKRDGAVSAARRLANLERAQERLATERAYDDPLAMAEYRMTGEAFAGTVVAAEPDRIDATGKRRVLRPRVTVETSEVVTAGPGSVLTSPARPGQEARVVEVMDGVPSRVTLELKGGMGRSLTPEPGSVPAVGEQVCYATFSDRFQPPSAFPPPEETPWTHGGPPPQYVPRDEDATEVWS